MSKWDMLFTLHDIFNCVYIFSLFICPYFCPGFLGRSEMAENLPFVSFLYER